MTIGQRIIYLLLGMLLLGNADAQQTFTKHLKDDAPANIQEVFDFQDDVHSRSGNNRSGVRLQRRKLTPQAGIDSSLTGRSASEYSPILVVVGLHQFPAKADWDNWSREGVEYVEYLGNRHWLLAIKTSINTAFELTRANSFSEFRMIDKIAPSVDGYRQNAHFYNNDRDLIALNITLLEEDNNAQAELIRQYHIDDVVFVDNSSKRTVSLVTKPEYIDEISQAKYVLSIIPGQWQQQSLMAGARAIVDADNIPGIFGNTLTGRGVKMANREGIQGGVHDDFKFSGSSVGRWTEVAGNSCLGNGICTGDICRHGSMTGGIMLGNGTLSSNIDGQPLEFHGIAPEAIFECYANSQARANVSNQSFVTGSCSYSSDYDGAVLGLEEDHRFHPHVTAAGNNGHTARHCSDNKGYFSIINGTKNPMIVGLAQLNGEIHPGSSKGPTFDGRIKPDIAAPAANYPYPDGEFSMEISDIELIRDGQSIFHWSFENTSIPSEWHHGWGHTADPFFGQNLLNIEQSSDGYLQINAESRPWGDGYDYTPFIGTETYPNNHFSNGPLNFTGATSDKLRVTYRTLDVDAGFFHLQAQWIRAFPPNNSNGGWYSQAQVESTTFGDGTWRKVEFAVGQDGEAHSEGDDHNWPTDVNPWAGQPIQYLGLRFTRMQIQHAPMDSEGYQEVLGTSAAAPIVAGGYALALEHLGDLYPHTDINQRHRPSVYSVISNINTIQGPPYNSTLKGIFIHTAKDMVEPDISFMPPNPDTGVQTSYYAGPDYSTGYGMLNIRSAIQLMTLNAESESDQSSHKIVENTLSHNSYHTYVVDIDQGLIDDQLGLKVTLVWDDAPPGTTSGLVAPKLVNNLGVFVKDPLGNIYYPWSLDLPYDIHSPSEPSPLAVEPEPITDSDIVPARQDQPNDRDNVEQVMVKRIYQQGLGQWTVYIVDNGIATPDAQKYSLVLSPWHINGQCHACSED